MRRFIAHSGLQHLRLCRALVNGFLQTVHVRLTRGFIPMPAQSVSSLEGDAN